jgi:hypothetical protein
VITDRAWDQIAAQDKAKAAKEARAKKPDPLAAKPKPSGNAWVIDDAEPLLQRGLGHDGAGFRCG